MRTITRIVGVVPAPVRLLLGLLLALALALGARTWLAAAGARRLERQRRELLDDVGLLQAALLPLAPVRIGPVGTSVAYRPADGPGAGGDFYDVFALGDGQVAVVVGDVSGHGRQALPHTALVRFTLRAYLEAGLSPRAAVRTAGAVLERQLGASFVTVVAATYDPWRRVLTYASAGHPPPLVSGSGPLALLTTCAAPPIGAGVGTGTRQTTVALPGRARVCFYTDGVTEARVGGELFGAERLGRELDGLAPGASATGLLERVAEATDVRGDDMAACLLDIGGDAGAAPAVLAEELELGGGEGDGARAERFLLACGVALGDVAEALRTVRAAVALAGGAVLEVTRPDGAPRVTVRHENVARLRVPPVRPRVVAGASR